MKWIKRIMWAMGILILLGYPWVFLAVVLSGVGGSGSRLTTLDLAVTLPIPVLTGVLAAVAIVLRAKREPRKSIASFVVVLAVSMLLAAILLDAWSMNCGTTGNHGADRL
jgi:hypothetical protein